MEVNRCIDHFTEAIRQPDDHHRYADADTLGTVSARQPAQRCRLASKQTNELALACGVLSCLGPVVSFGSR
ncbi:hypothetical protein ml_147 [Mollivirus sibericum]|uniref:hypothetical protein n=1 Tax=Mollivirus sibericum TaxID=1678078 RepID=UPI0006B2DC25|nr:hypothetical protein ml_147 [Mollivirus sibericum]ALD61949.1 hypothetical protein ml_147 [Mollivirus sibericum]